MSKKIKLEKELVAGIKEIYQRVENCNTAIVENELNRKRIDQFSIELWAQWEEAQANLREVFEGLEQEYGFNSELDLGKGTILPSGDFNKDEE